MVANFETPDRAAWLKGTAAYCRTTPSIPARPWRVVLLGPPGIGKKTQAALLASQLGACRLSFKEVFDFANDTPEADLSPSMVCALEYRRLDRPVPDPVIINLLVERTRCLCCKGGFILEGYPYSNPQAKALDKLLAGDNLRLDAVLQLELTLKMLVARRTVRRSCLTCRATYDETIFPPRELQICDYCRGPLAPCPGDKPKIIREQTRNYLEETAPLIRYYRREKLLCPIDAAGSPQEVLARIMSALLAIGV